MVAGHRTSGVKYVAYRFSLRRNRPARPINPVPRRLIDAGSGVVIVLSPLPVILVSPLESVVDPLKKPLPVLTVSWTVAPTTDVPVNQVPDRAPVNV